MLVILSIKLLVYNRGAQAGSGDSLLVTVHVASQLLPCLANLVTHLALCTPGIQVMFLNVIYHHIPPLVCEVTLLASETVGLVFDQFTHNNFIDGFQFLNNEWFFEIDLPETLISRNINNFFIISLVSQLD